MSLANQIVYVAGGCGIVGSGIVYNLLRNGAKVWVTSRNQKNLDELASKASSLSNSNNANLKLHQTNISNEKECIQVKNEILKQEGRLDHVIASLGSFWSNGALSNQTVDEFQRVLDDLVTSHFIVYKTFSKELSKQPHKTSYTFITGGLGEACILRDSSLLTVGTSAQYGLYQAAIGEFKNNINFKINEIRFYMWIKKRLDNEFDPAKSPMLVGHDWTAKFVSKIIQSHKGGLFKIMNRKKGDEMYATL